MRRGTQAWRRSARRCSGRASPARWRRCRWLRRRSPRCMSPASCAPWSLWREGVQLIAELPRFAGEFFLRERWVSSTHTLHGSLPSREAAYADVVGWGENADRWMIWLLLNQGLLPPPWPSPVSPCVYAAYRGGNCYSLCAGAQNRALCAHCWTARLCPLPLSVSIPDSCIRRYGRFIYTQVSMVNAPTAPFFKGSFFIDP